MSAFVFLKSVRDLFKKCFLLVVALVFLSFAAFQQPPVQGKNRKIGRLGV